jgi:hypothetical protein
MASIAWGTFAAAAPELAAVGRTRLAGRVAYFATNRASDGAPRVHPVTPILSDSKLFLFMEPTSPKGRDIRMDPRYALHCGVEDYSGGEGEFFVSGTASPSTADDLRAEAVAAATYAPADRYVLFHLLIDRATLRRYVAGQPQSQSWAADG